jgi:hypothetical protein
MFQTHNDMKKLISLEVILKWLSVCLPVQGIYVLFQSVVGHEEEIAP